MLNEVAPVVPAEVSRVPADDAQELPSALATAIQQAVSPPRAQRLAVEPADVRKGLGQLVLTLVKLIHEVLERQAIRRMEAGNLTDDELERLGTTLMLQAEEIRRLCREFGVREDELNLDLGPVGKLL